MEYLKTSSFYSPSDFPSFLSNQFLPYALCLLSIFKKEKEQIGKKKRKEKHPKTTYLQGKFYRKINENKFQPVFVPVFLLGFEHELSSVNKN